MTKLVEMVLNDVWPRSRLIVQDRLHVVECETRILRTSDEADSADGIGPESPLSADAANCLDETSLLVVTDCRYGNAGLVSQLPDREFLHSGETPVRSLISGCASGFDDVTATTYSPSATAVTKSRNPQQVASRDTSSSIAVASSRGNTIRAPLGSAATRVARCCMSTHSRAWSTDPFAVREHVMGSPWESITPTLRPQVDLRSSVFTRNPANEKEGTKHGYK